MMIIAAIELNSEMTVASATARRHFGSGGAPSSPATLSAIGLPPPCATRFRKRFMPFSAAVFRVFQDGVEVIID
jgi:hypothetical protein